jgi:hypothetical protein
MAPILAPAFGVTFLKGRFSLKMGRIASFLDTIQRLSKTCGFLFNSFQAIALLMGQKKGVHFLREHMLPQKWDLLPPF